MNAAVWINIFSAAFMASLLYVILKYFQHFRINNVQGLTVNYFVAGATSLLIKRNYSTLEGNDFIWPALIIGLLFITVFYITALTTQKCGVAVTSIAGKMSMVIPITAGILLFKDQLTVLKVTGIVIALVAVYLATASPGEKEKSDNWLYPLLLFIGSGMVDTSIKIAQHYFINEENFQTQISLIFFSAGIAGVILLLFRFLRSRARFELKSIPAGIILGVANYFSLEFLVRCLAHHGIESSLVFALVNLLVVLFSALFAFLWFREKPAAANLAGLGLAIVAIVLLNYS